ncbi:hypothetical protein B8W74_04630 [Arthrobacter agilis]|nr:hypothetical protein B8W74_04630 [Arthrobacter agilis]
MMPCCWVIVADCSRSVVSSCWNRSERFSSSDFVAFSSSVIRAARSLASFSAVFRASRSVCRAFWPLGPSWPSVPSLPSPEPSPEPSPDALPEPSPPAPAPSPPAPAPSSCITASPKVSRWCSSSASMPPGALRSIPCGASTAGASVVFFFMVVLLHRGVGPAGLAPSGRNVVSG